jgi:signal transduction histidine kinase/DNA-binding response OmpR family regulator/CHASE3 domain sensor protein
MSPSTGVLFLLSGISLSALVRGLSCQRPANVWLSLAGISGFSVVLIGMIFTLGYTLSKPLLYGAKTIPMALTTAFSFIFLGGGLTTAAILHNPVSGRWFRTLNDMSIARQLRLALGLILALVLFLGLLAWKQTDLLRMQTKAMYDHPLQVQNAVGDFEIDVLIMHGGMRILLLAESDQEFATVLQDIDAHKADAFQKLEILRNHNLGPPDDVTTLYKNFVKWNSIREETIRLWREGKIKEAAARTKSSGVGGVQLDVLRDHLRKINVFARNKADQLYREAGEHANNLKRQLTVAITFIVLLSLLASYVLLRGIIGPLARLTAAADQFRQGERKVRSGYVSANELGALSAAFNLMADTIETEEDIKENTAQIAGVMLRETELPTFCRELLKKLLQHTGSQIGAVYLLNPQKTEFEPFESIGLAAGGHASFSSTEPEGEFGAALASGQIQHITDIPEDTRFTFAAVGGDFKPREIITIPLLSDHETTAVLSLASLRSYNAGAIRLVKDVLGILTARMNGVLAYRQIQELAQRLDHQNRELELQRRELVAQTEKLQAQSEELQAQTQELQAQTQELERQRLQVEEADRLKSEFLANMSHELRTPLNSVLALTQLMIARGTGKDAAQETEYLQVIDRNGRHLLHLINDILDIARIESGRVQLTLTSIDPGETCARVLGTVRPLAAERGLELKADYGDLPRIFTDEDKLQQILINLLSNAIKFTEQGEIRLEAAVDSDQVCFTVRDTGVGIAPEFLPHIFDKFRQADGSSTRRFEGTGLGLAICRSLAKFLGGEITVVSEVGRGSTFTLTLPQTCPELKEVDDEPANRTFSDAAPSQPQPTPSAKRREPPLILVVEGNPVAALQVRTVFEELGYAVKAAPSGIEALAAIPEVRPDLIVLDLMLPDVDGFQVLEQIRAMPATATIPVLVLTARELTPEDRNRLAHHHIRHFAQKGSLNRDELAACVRRLLGRAAATVVPHPAPAPQPPVSRRPGGPILVVEDNRDNLLVITAVLDEAGYQYVTAADGPTAVARAREELPALIIMDMQLPGLGGLEAAKEIKADPHLKGSPVVALTAMAMRGDREEILAAGLDDYLAKPFDPEELIQLVRRWLGS